MVSHIKQGFHDTSHTHPSSFRASELLWRWLETSKLKTTVLFTVTYPVPLKEEPFATFYSWRKWRPERLSELPKFTQPISSLIPKPMQWPLTFKSCLSLLNFRFFPVNNGFSLPHAVIINPSGQLRSVLIRASDSVLHSFSFCSVNCRCPKEWKWGCSGF